MYSSVSVKFITLLCNQSPEVCSSCKTKILFLLNNNTSIPLASPFYFLSLWIWLFFVVVVEFLVVSDCNSMDCSTPGYSRTLHYHPEFAQTCVHWISDTIQPFHPLLSPSPPAFNLSHHQGHLQWVSFHIRWPNYWSFSFRISPTNKYSGLISFRIEWSPCSPTDSQESSPTPQFKSIISSMLSFLYGQLSHPYLTTGINHSFD